jgi:uncharacterized membrane-anchored protein YhcB (DUF1043 family)
MSWIIPAVCGLLVAIVLGPIIVGLLEYRSETNQDLKKQDDRAEMELHMKHLARMNGKQAAK